MPQRGMLTLHVPGSPVTVHAMPLWVTPSLLIPDTELTIRTARSGGPGGQNVNKVATKVQVWFAFERSRSLSPVEKARLRALQPHRVTLDGELLVSSDETRSQETNKQLALSRLAACIRQARTPPRSRIVTRPSRGAKQRRLDEKRARSRVKANRRATGD